MAITKPNSGELVTTTSVTDMYDSVKSRVNSVSTTQFEDACLGEQHLPSIIPKLDGTLTPAADRTNVYADFTVYSPHNLVVPSTHCIEYETGFDVFSDHWAEVTTLDNGGSGYILPPCKVLVMCDVSVASINKTLGAPTSNNQAWIAVCHRGTSEAGVVEDEFSPVNMGMVSGWNPDGTGYLGDSVQEQMSIWFIIDRTMLETNWSLEYIQLRATCGYGEGATYDTTPRFMPQKIVLSNYQLSFCSFYRDE